MVLGLCSHSFEVICLKIKQHVINFMILKADSRKRMHLNANFVQKFSKSAIRVHETPKTA